MSTALDYLFLHSTNQSHSYDKAGHVSTNWDLNALNSHFCDGEWFGPPPCPVRHETGMKLAEENKSLVRSLLTLH